jgi:2-oxoisovalerate dehydrogenase E2 component (dihydrolipoyl transacylase)
MDFHLPELGEGVYEAEVARWLVKEGDQVKPGQGLLEVLTDKATMEVPAPFTATIESLRVKEGDKIKVGAVVLAYADKSPAGARNKIQPSETPKTVPATNAPTNKAPLDTSTSPPVKAAPSVRVMARQLGVDLNSINGSGPHGRILIGDVTAAVPSAGAKPKATEFDYGKPGTRLKLTGLRRAIAEHMVKAKQTIPHYTYVDEVDVSQLVSIRASLREAGVPPGLKITYMPFFIKAVVHALKEVPLVNASLDEAAGEIVLHDHYHIGVAVATSMGLVVPVVRDADRLSILELAAQVDRLSAEVRAGKAKRADLMDGTFTITSIGNIGGLFATPIIPHPQVGILGVGKIVKRPIYDDAGQLRAADMLYLSFSFDHRVLDGAIGAAFGNAVIKQLWNAAALLAEEGIG